jgi:hypothetical protein
MGQAPRDMIVRYTPRAFPDRDALFVYWLERNPLKAEEIVRDIKHRVAEPAPAVARPPNRQSLSRCPMGHSPIPIWCSIGSKDAQLLSSRFAIPRGGRGVMSDERFLIASRGASTVDWASV